MRIRALPVGLALVAIVALAAARPQGQAPTLRVSRATAAAGDTVVVSWSALQADSVYITGLGARGPAGRERVAVRATARFVLYALTPSGIQAAADSVFVPGSSKGGDDLPERFSAPRRYRVQAPSFAALLHRVDDGLQRRLGYPAPATSLHSPTFTTEHRQRADLVARGEPIAMRWVAYRVTVAPSTAVPGAFECFISTSIWYRRPAERDPRQQPEGEMNVREADRLAGLL